MPSWKCSIYIVILVLYLLDVGKCSRVIDNHSQRSVQVSDFCPSMPYCREGTHVMCMYYDHDRVMGQNCLNPLNVSISSDAAESILHTINSMRSKLANGVEVGFNRHYLPRAYNMPRLQWDAELATFAQVLANQCLFRHDLCRATKKFSNPGQIVSIVRFYYPDWKRFRPSQLNYPGLNDKGYNIEKLNYAIKESCLNWYQGKAFITGDMVKRPVDFNQHPHLGDGKYYLSMIAAEATHIGCGLSAYVDYGFIVPRASNKAFYNAVEVVCNFSAQTAPGQSVYHTNIPPNANPHSKCGCVFGYLDDEDCLCVEDPNYPGTMPYPCNGKDCVPAVVILPIIAMEDAPLHALEQHYQDTRKRQTGLEIFNKGNTLNSITTKKVYTHGALEKALEEAKKDVERRSKITNNDMRNVQTSNNGYSHSRGMYHGPHSSKQHQNGSSSSKSNKFGLPVKGSVIRDVLPRKDFTKIQNLVDIYFNKKRNLNGFKTRKTIDSLPSVVHDITSNIYRTNYNNVTNEDNDMKVLYLLDDLEQEVKHTDLTETENNVLDAKLRKIYGHVNDTPRKSMSFEKNRQNDAETNEFLKYEDRVNKHFLEEQHRNAHRSSYSIYNDKSSEQSNNGINMLDIKKRLLKKETNGNVDLGSLKNRLEKPINEKEYGLSTGTEYKSRSINALIPLSPASIELRNMDKEINPNDVQRRPDIRKNSLRNDRYRSTDYDDGQDKHHLDEIGNLDYERRKYYQEKLDLLEEILQKSQEFQQYNNIDLQRPMKPDRNELQMRPVKKNSPKVSFYPPNKPRSVHVI